MRPTLWHRFRFVCVRVGGRTIIAGIWLDTPRGGRHADERERILYDRRGGTITEDLTIDHITDV